VRFGLLGTGYWAAETHAAALVAAPGTELAAVWGRDPAKAASVADRYGIRPYDDVDELIAAVDAVAIALPPQVQAPLAARAARAGKHLFLDKPLALTVAAADEVVAAVDATGVDSVVFFTSRFNPPAVDFLHHALATGGWDGGRATLLGTVVGTPYDASPWRHQYGGLWDVGPHALSLLIPVLGRITGVSAALGPHQTATALLTHESGAVSTMTLSLASPVTTWDVSFYGTSGWGSVPPVTDAVAAAVVALEALTGGDRSCDVHFARDVVAVLVRAAADLAAAAT
jgi:predicted dehydrogenase